MADREKRGSRRVWLTWDLLAHACGLGMMFVAATLVILGETLLAGGPALSGILLFTLGFVLRSLRQGFRRLARITAIVDGTDLIVIATNRRGVINRFNPAAEKLLGYSAAEVIGKLKPSAFHLADDDQAPQSRPAGEAAQAERSYLRRDGTTFPAIVTHSPLLDECGELIGHFEMGIDITERKAGERALRDNQEFIHSVAVTSPTIFYTFDLERRKVVYASRPIGSSLGYSEEQCGAMSGDPLPSVMHPEDLDILFGRYLACRELGDGEVFESEFRCLSADGRLRWLITRDVVFKRDSEGTPIQILANLMDITDRRMLTEQVDDQVVEIQDKNLALTAQATILKEKQTQLESLAFADGLTGIANHRSFQESLAKAFDASRKDGQNLHLMLLDVDHFKVYNDDFGHPAGDLVLKRVAQILRETCPDDCMPARYGGEEFAVLCRGFGSHDFMEFCEDIRHAIESFEWPGRRVTVSIGAVSLTAKVGSPSELVKSADNSLYSSKASGRNCITYYDFDRLSA